MKYQWMKKITAVVTAAVCVFGMSGCTPRFDAEGYVQAMLDSKYKGEFNQYMELTTATVDAATKSYENSLKAEANEICAYFGISSLHDETVYEFVEFARWIYMGADYEIVEKEKIDGGYEVTLKVHPVENLSSVKQEVSECSVAPAFTTTDPDMEDSDDTEFDEEASEQQQSDDESSDLSEEEDSAESDSAYEDAIVDVLHDSMDGITYGGEEAVTVKVLQDKDGYFYLDEEDNKKLDTTLVKYE